MIRDFEIWNNNLGEASQLDELRGQRVGIEAAHYLQHRVLNHPHVKEPLVPALGGLPFGFEPHFKNDLEKFAASGVEPFFVFSGLDIAKQDKKAGKVERKADKTEKKHGKKKEKKFKSDLKRADRFEFLVIEKLPSGRRTA